MKKIYLVKKDPDKPADANNWLVMNSYDNLVKTTSVRWMPALMTIIKLLESVAKSVLKNGVQKKTGTII